MPIKSILSSKTFWGAVISLIAQFLPTVFVKLGTTPDATVDWLVTAVGFALTVYGRLTANSKVTLTGK